MNVNQVKCLLFIAFFGLLGFVLSPVGMDFIHDYFPATHNMMLRRMLPYSFMVFPFSLLFLMISILMLLLFIRTNFFNHWHDNEDPKELLETLLEVEHSHTKKIAPEQSNEKLIRSVRFPDDYSVKEGFVYSVFGCLLISMAELEKMGWLSIVSPIVGCVFLAVGVVIIVYAILQACLYTEKTKALIMGVLGLFLCFIPFGIEEIFWVYRFALTPAGLLLLFLSSYRFWYHKSH